MKAIVGVRQLPVICSDRTGSAQRRGTRCLQGFGTSLQVGYPFVLDHILKMDVLLNCLMEITLFIEFICDKKDGD